MFFLKFTNVSSQKGQNISFLNKFPVNRAYKSVLVSIYYQKFGIDSLIDLLELSFMTDLCLVFVFEMTGICGALNEQVFTYIIVEI